MEKSKSIIPFKNWEDTTSVKCRWSEYAEELIGNWVILWEDAECDYQGHAHILAYRQGKFRYLSWFYGSCGGCDSYEDMPEDDIRKEFHNNVMMEFNDNSFCTWMKMLDSSEDDKFTSFNEIFTNLFRDDSIKYISEPARLTTKLDSLIILKD